MLTALGREPSFQINSYENWLPACPPCNNSKRATVWDASPLIQLHLQRAASKAGHARKTADEVLSRQKVANALTVLLAAHENDTITEAIKQQLLPLVKDFSTGLAAASRPDVFRLTPTYSEPLFTGFGSCPSPNCYTGDLRWRDWPVDDGAVLKAGDCDTCGTWGVECPDCGDVTGFVWDEQVCDSCDNVFRLVRDRKGGEVEEVELVRH